MANYPGSLDDNASLHDVTDNVDDVLAVHHNDPKDAIIAIETKLGTGADTATDGDYLKGTGAGTSGWADFDTDVSANSDVGANTTHRGSDGSDHTFLDQSVIIGAAPAFLGTNITAIPAANVAVLEIGSATYDSLEDTITTLGSAGCVSGGVISDATGAEINVAALTGMIRDDVTALDTLLSFDFAGIAGVAIPTDTVRYVGIEYNSGTPQVVLKETDTWNENDEFPLGVVINEGDVLHIMNNPQRIGDAIQGVLHRLYETEPLQRADRLGGLILGETGSRYVTVTEGELYDRLNEFVIAAIDTTPTGDTFDSYSSAGLESAADTQWDNDNYDNSGTLTTLGANKYANLWFYIESDGNLVCVYGTAQYASIGLAEAESPPTTLPDRLVVSGKLIGRIVFQKGDSSAQSIESAFDVAFSPTVVTDHGNLAGLSDDDHSQYIKDSEFTQNSGVLVGTGAGTFQEETGDTLRTSLGLSIGTDILAEQAIGISDDNLLEVDGSPNSAEYARFTANGLEGRTEAEFKGDFNLEIGTDVLAEQTIGIADNNLLEVDGSPNSAEFAKFTANGLEGRTFAEVMGDLSGQAGADFSMNTKKITNVVDPAADQDAATKKYVDDNLMLIDSTPGSNLTASGNKAVFTANENQTFGDICYIDADGEMAIADASVIATATAIAMCIDATIDAAASGNYLMFGIVRDDSWDWTVGGDSGKIYLSLTGTTTNTLTQTAPSGTDEVVQLVGVATHADRIIFSPQLAQVEHD